MYDPANGLRRIPLPRTPVNKGNRRRAEAALDPDPFNSSQRVLDRCTE